MAAGNQDGLGLGPTVLSVYRPVRRLSLAGGDLTRRDAASQAFARRFRLCPLPLFGVIVAIRDNCRLRVSPVASSGSAGQDELGVEGHDPDVSAGIGSFDDLPVSDVHGLVFAGVGKEHQVTRL